MFKGLLGAPRWREPARALALAALFALGCASDKGLATDDLIDADEDGYTAGADCDDADPAVSPAATELCNGVDDDCDGNIDEDDAADASTWYADADGDGFGDAATPASACAAPSGFVADATDCDDIDAAVSPAATELCNGLDDDCDGNTDEDDAADASTWYADADGDGFGDAATPATACAAPSGFIADATDCDDTDGDVNPGATEVCEDGLDNNCDGSAGACAWTDGTYADADALLLGEDYDYPAGYRVLLGDLDGDGYDDVIVAASSVQGLVYVVAGPVSGTSALADAGWRFEGETAPRTGGFDALALGDFDGSGAADLALGAPSYTTANSGAVLVFADPGPASYVASDATTIWYTTTRTGYLGGEVRAISDLDGDGGADLIARAEHDGSATTHDGVIYVLPGAAVGELDAEVDAHAQIRGTTYEFLAYHGLDQAGDVDGDGVADILASASYTDASGDGVGAAWVLDGSTVGTVYAEDVGVRLVGEEHNSATGRPVAGGGDLDGDGYDDVLVLARNGPDYGCVYAVLGPITAEQQLADAHARIFPTDGTLWDHRPDALAGGHDLNGDGRPDIAIGLSEDGDDQSAIAVYLTLPEGTSVAEPDAFLYEVLGYAYGWGALTAGDVNADGYADLLVGEMGAPRTGSRVGAAYLFLGTGW